MGAVTNTHGLPAALVSAVLNDPYTGGGDISATKLIDAPQRRVLQGKHRDDISIDVSERIWSLLGQGVHNVLERASEESKGVAIAEERLYATVDGWVVSGQFDRLHLASKTLQDYKVTTTYKSDGSDSWTQQLNVLRWLAIQNGYEVDTLEIVAIFRDWRKTEADRKPDYPRAAAAIIPVSVWPLDVTYKFIKDRVALHQQASAGEFVPCTDEERWYAGSTWAIVKEGGKRALRVLNQPPAPEDIPEGAKVVERAGEYRRCMHYCDVSEFCAQWGDTPTNLPPASEGP